MYSNDQLRSLFQGKFNLQDWNKFVLDVVKPTAYRQTPEQLDLSPDEGTGYYLGQKKTDDNYEIGLFYLRLNSSVKSRRVGLRQLVKPYVRYLVDAALVVFDDGNNWRLSFICDLQGEATAPKRYTFVFGDANNWYNTAVSRFIELQSKGVNFANLKEAFSVEALTKEFYNELFDWYQWAVSPDSGIYFPNNTETSDDDFEDIDKKIIRLITRLMFVWFIKQKGLVPDSLFEEKDLRKVLVDFDPKSSEQGNYYNAILQNLFFATLNRAIEDEEGKRGFAKLKGQRDVKSLYRYAEMFTISEEEVLCLFSEIPFLNGGLFECLDKTKKIDGVETAYNYDGFSRNDFIANGRYRHRAFIPNRFFFDEKQGLLNILKRYNFTIEENTPNEQQVALDPELLGKVFENLLGAYNPETKETARNQSGSFYTPREIVSYMVDESLIAYLGDTPLVRSMFKDDFEPDELHWSDYQLIAGKLKSVKILDPACGSGAFPMGLLNRIVDLLQKIETDKTTYELKLNIIENCIYGSDIQSIAAQITKLRFFISLICDCEKDANKPNFGIPTLPNLETKFVTANSLIGLHKVKEGEFVGSLFEDPEIGATKEALRNVRHEHFKAKTASAKQRLRKQDEELRQKLAILLSEDNDYAPEDAKQMAAWNPYDQNAVSPFFDSEWMFGVTDGFDIVIGNPPYIQLQNEGGKLGKLYQPCGFNTFASTGDIYCLFYERGHQLLKQNGHLCYITSNKWMRAGYGEKTRIFFANETNPKLLIDFAGVKIFESATVDTNILLFAKANNQHQTICAVTNKQNKDSVKNLSHFVKSNHSLCDFSSCDSWVILSPIEQSIKRKIESIGTPLKDWDINIYRGVLTGCNEAFIISGEKREEILQNCTTIEEKQRTAELIRPILRGRDIKRYGYEWANLYLIATFPARKYNIEQYPAVKHYLLTFAYDYLIENKNELVAKNHLEEYCMKKLSQSGEYIIINGKHVLDGNGNKEKGRKKTTNKWFETQDSISYWDDFFKPKICWKAVGRNLTFAIVEAGTFLTAPASFIQAGKYNEYIMAFLCSSVGKYFIYQNSDTTGAGDIMLNIQSLIKFPIPISAEIKHLSEMVVQQSKEYDESRQNEINHCLYRVYGFNEDEIEQIECT